MSEFAGNMDNNDKRILFTQKRLRESLKGATNYEDTIRVAARIGVRAVMDFNKNLFAENFLEQFEAGELESTLITLRLNILNAGVKELKKRCDSKHEFPKSCDCHETYQILMGQREAVEPLKPTMLIDELGEENE